jgi:hypothetical protein
MKFFYSLLIYAISIVITLSIITLFVTGTSHYDELKIYTYSQGKFIVDYPSNYTVDSEESTLNTDRTKFPTPNELKI